MCSGSYRRDNRGVPSRKVTGECSSAKNHSNDPPICLRNSITTRWRSSGVSGFEVERTAVRGRREKTLKISLSIRVGRPGRHLNGPSY